METYFYTCRKCSFINVIPAYWVSFSPEEEMQLKHVDPDNKEDCINEVLKIIND
jgi:hypothetical protein